MIEPLDAPPALIDRVHDRLVSAIADGSLPPGERLTQETIAARLGVSRQPVSHALQILRRRGLVAEAGKRGLVVAPLDARRLRDLYQVRSALDGLAARLAAARVRAGAVTVAQRTALYGLVAAGKDLAGHGSVADLVAADVTFHSEIHRLSGNSALAEAVAGEWPHFMRSMGMVLADAGLRRRIWDEHEHILDGIFTGDPEAAESAARWHTDQASELTARKLEAVAPRA